jgi:hypothetical protein
MIRQHPELFPSTIEQGYTLHDILPEFGFKVFPVHPGLWLVPIFLEYSQCLAEKQLVSGRVIWAFLALSYEDRTNWRM